MSSVLQRQCQLLQSTTLTYIVCWVYFNKTWDSKTYHLWQKRGNAYQLLLISAISCDMCETPINILAWRYPECTVLWQHQGHEEKKHEKTRPKAWRKVTQCQAWLALKVLAWCRTAATTTTCSNNNNNNNNNWQRVDLMQFVSVRQEVFHVDKGCLHRHWKLRRGHCHVAHFSILEATCFAVLCLLTVGKPKNCISMCGFLHNGSG